jgi:bifunctional enzyme CysN/CysC
MQGLLKFITCGSVDDGKSTLIGHMLYDAKLLFADQKQALELDSKVGSRGGEIDYSLLLDGLMAEREQGITIDVAYRYFSTQNRSFIVADTPGHEEYTRNMAVGASFADLAVILVDASQGVLVQTKRHTRICALMGIKHFVFAVNKMDLVDYAKDTFDQIKRDIRLMTAEYDLDSLHMIPVSATEGDNITNPSVNMSWYKDGTLLSYLEQIDVRPKRESTGFVMPVQRVVRPDHTFRGFQGQIEAGSVKVGDAITVLPSHETACVKSILVTDRQETEAVQGEAVTIELDKEIDVSRGCVICREHPLEVSNLFSTRLLWMDDNRLVAGKNFFLKLGTKLIPATVMNIKYKIDVNEGTHIPTERIYKNEIAKCEIAVADKIAFDEFEDNEALGSFILIDRVTNMTSACGIVLHSMRRSDNLVWQNLDITREYRSEQLAQTPKTLWFTGLSGSGKSTLANALEKRLALLGKHTMLLDGDNVRMGLNRNLGFKEQDRIENIRRVAEVAKLMNDAGLIVLSSFISPYENDRQRAREIIGVDSFVEVYVNTPLEECERRDVKGLYKKARAGEIPNFTGISSPYEIPQTADIVIETVGKQVEDTVDELIKLLGYE